MTCGEWSFEKSWRGFPQGAARFPSRLLGSPRSGDAIDGISECKARLLDSLLAVFDEQVLAAGWAEAMQVRGRAGGESG